MGPGGIFKKWGHEGTRGLDNGFSQSELVIEVSLACILHVPV
jgi:hypothetical protein